MHSSRISRFWLKVLRIFNISALSTAAPVSSAPTLMSSFEGFTGTGMKRADCEPPFLLSLFDLTKTAFKHARLFGNNSLRFKWLIWVAFKSVTDFNACLRFLIIFKVFCLFCSLTFQQISLKFQKCFWFCSFQICPPTALLVEYSKPEWQLKIVKQKVKIVFVAQLIIRIYLT